MTTRWRAPSWLLAELLALVVVCAGAVAVATTGLVPDLALRAPGAGPSATPPAPPDGTPAASSSATARPGDPSTAMPEQPSEEPAPSPSESEETCLAVPRLTPLRALTFNIHGAVGPSGHDLARIASEIRQTGADVVLLQEVDRFRERSAYADQAAWLADELDMHHAFAANLVRTPGTGRRVPEEYGLATLSRHPILEAVHEPLPHPPGTERRGVLRTRLDLGRGQVVDVFNTHLEHSSPSARMAQARSVRDLLAADPVVDLLGGDLNTVAGTPAYAALTTRLRDPWPVVGDGPGFTVPPHAPRRRIDHLLHDDTMVALAAGLLVSAVSDHHGVWVELMLTGDPRCRRLR